MARGDPRRRSRALERAIVLGDTGTAASLIAAGVEVDPRDAEHGETTLMLAAQAGSLELARLLLNRGAELEAVDAYYGRTAFAWAVSARRNAVAEFLLERGARIDARNRDGLTPLMHAVEMGHDEQVAFLLAHGADPNLDADGETPLAEAEMQGRADIALLLRRAGAVR
jgi:uncharacterized protein